MAEAKHTPGPWQFAPLMFRSEPTPDGMGYIRPLNEDGKEICHHGDMDRPGEENLANARLIAAAPDLLEAAIDALETLEIEFPDHPYSDYLRAAIAKAKGEA